MPYFELVEGGRTIAAFNDILKAQQAYAKVAGSRFGQRFEDYLTARAFIFQADMQDDLFIRQPEPIPNEDDILGGIV